MPEEPVTAPAPLRVPAAVVAHILAHAADDAPHEACGLLIGAADTVHRAVPAVNIQRSPNRYRIDPADHFAALRAARREGLDVIGAYHSHPASAAVPSPADHAAAFPDFVFLIASGMAAPALRAWELVAGNFVERPLVRT